VSSEATGAVGRRRARASARALGGGDNGTVELGVARRGEEGAAFIGRLALGDDG
jgi:hypothetical protein